VAEVVAEVMRVIEERLPATGSGPRAGRTPLAARSHEPEA
jgi:hypothetical protein